MQINRLRNLGNPWVTPGCYNSKYSTFIEAKYLGIQQFILNHILSKMKVYSDGKQTILWKVKWVA